LELLWTVPHDFAFLIEKHVFQLRNVHIALQASIYIFKSVQRFLFFFDGKVMNVWIFKSQLELLWTGPHRFAGLNHYVVDLNPKRDFWSTTYLIFFHCQKIFAQTIVWFEKKKYVWMHSLCHRFQSQEGFLINKYTYLMFLHCQKNCTLLCDLKKDL